MNNLELIKYNPFRIIGILANASAKDIQKRRSMINAFLKVNKIRPSDYDFDMLESIDRDESMIDKAFANIEQINEKVYYALFWFTDESVLEKTAISNLQDGSNSKSLEIWKKITDNKEVTERNFEAFNNLGTLQLLSNDLNEIKSGILNKIKLIESDFFENFIHLVADQTFTLSSSEQLENFADGAFEALSDNYNTNQLIALFSGTTPQLENHINNKAISKPINTIEFLVDNCKKERKTNKKQAYKYGVELYHNSLKELTYLKSILNENNLKYKVAADSLAKELMQCGIDYFNAYKEDSDPSDKGLQLLSYAQEIAVDSQTKERIQENVRNIEEWAKTAVIQKDIIFIRNQVTSFSSLLPSLMNAENLVNQCKNRLLNIKNELGSNDEVYITLSSAIVNNAMGMLIEIVNKQQENNEIPSAAFISNVDSLMNNIGRLDMNHTSLKNFRENRKGLKEWAKTAPVQLDITFIAKQLKSIQYGVQTLNNADNLISKSKSRLQNIRRVLGASDSLYLDLSNAVVNNALGIVISVVNNAQRDFQDSSNSYLSSSLIQGEINFINLENIISNAVKTVYSLDSFDMNAQTRRKYTENKNTINSIQRQLESVSRPKPTPKPTPKPKPPGGCYIATMAYGDYNHPQVIELRKFRDEVLQPTEIGRSFIRFYYKYSPILVEKLKSYKRVNKLIRKGLDHFVKIINK